ncbi:MAG: hypothetical protein Q7S29_04670 [Candidatus Peribacter sp.]|nr:hypothetical protein [Candidatus Peribacter sp.]
MHICYSARTMTKVETDPHSRYFCGTREAFNIVRGTAKWRDPPIAGVLEKIRRRVLLGGFPVNMEVEPLQYDAMAESVRVPKHPLSALRNESEAMCSVRQQIQKIIRAMDRELRQKTVPVGIN